MRNKGATYFHGSIVYHIYVFIDKYRGDKHMPMSLTQVNVLTVNDDSKVRNWYSVLLILHLQKHLKAKMPVVLVYELRSL